MDNNDNWDIMDYQGKSRKQVADSEFFAAVGIVGIILIIAGLVVYNALI